MIDVKFRRLMLQCPAVANKAVLSTQQVEFANYVHTHSGRVCASDAADRFSVSVPHASAILKQLSEKGYLKRLKVTQPSGGVQYEYTPAFELLGESN